MLPDSGVRLSTKVLAAMRVRILSGAVPAGARLTERSVAKDLGVSPTPVREAITRLEHEGLVRIIPRVGAIVRETSPDRVLQLFEVREALECKAISLFAERATEVDIRVVSQLAERRDHLRPGEHSPEIYDNDHNFHTFIQEHCGNKELARSVETLDLIGQCLSWTTFVQGTPGREGIVLQPGHVEMVKAIVDRDSKLAESVMAEHIRAAARAVSMAAALSRLSVENGHESAAERPFALELEID